MPAIPVGPVDGNSIYIYLSPAIVSASCMDTKPSTASIKPTRTGKRTYFPNGNNNGQYTMVNGNVVDTATMASSSPVRKYPLGNTDPKFNSAFINEFCYKDFLSFSFQFDWIYGSHIYSETKEWMYRDGIRRRFHQKRLISMASKEPILPIAPAPTTHLWGSTHGSGNEETKDYFLVPASFLRLRNVAVGLDFARLYKIKYCKKLQLVFSGRNLWTKTKYPGMDPEISSLTPNSSYTRGMDNSSIPNLKSFQAGLNVGF